MNLQEYAPLIANASDLYITFGFILGFIGTIIIFALVDITKYLTGKKDRKPTDTEDKQ